MSLKIYSILIKGEKKKKKKVAKNKIGQQKTNIKVVCLNLTLIIITLHANGLHITIKERNYWHG